MARPISWKQVMDASHRTFFANRTQDDLTALIAVGLFQQETLARGLKPEEALPILRHADLVKSFLTQADKILHAKQGVAVAYALEQKQKLENLEQSSKRIEDGIAELRTVSKDIHKASRDMRSESQTLFGEMRQRSDDLKAATEKNAQTSADIRAATTANEATARNIATQVTALGTAAGNIHAEVKKAVKNTSTVTAVLVGLGVGFMAGLPTNYVYERHFSVEAMNKKAEAERKAKDAAGASSSPPSDSDKAASALSSPHDSFGGAFTGTGMLDLLNEGQSVKLFKQDGSSICLKMQKPIPCIGAEALKSPPQKATDAPKSKRPSDIGQRKHHHRHHCP